MRINRIAMLLVILVSSVVTATVGDEQPAESSTSTSDPTTQQEMEIQSTPRATGSATTFTPTEQIKADSSVAFPVDI